MVFAFVVAAMNVAVTPLIEERVSKDTGVAAWKESGAVITLRHVLELVAHAAIALAALRHIDGSVTSDAPSPEYVLVLILLIMPSIHTLASFAGKTSVSWSRYEFLRTSRAAATFERLQISSIAMLLYAVGAAMPVIGLLSLVDAVSLEAADNWPIAAAATGGFVFFLWAVLLLVGLKKGEMSPEIESITERSDAVALASHLTATLTIVTVLLFLNKDHNRHDGTSIQFLVSQVLVITSGSFSVASTSIGRSTHHAKNVLYSSGRKPEPGAMTYVTKVAV